MRLEQERRGGVGRDLLKRRVTKEGLLAMRTMIRGRLAAFSREKLYRPLLVVICGRPGTGKSTIGGIISALRFGMNEGEVGVFEHDEARSMLRYNSFIDPVARTYSRKLGIKTSEPRLIIVEGYNTIPAWADKNNADLVIELTADDEIRLKRISSRGWSKEYSKGLVQAPRIPYNKIDLVIDTSVDMREEVDFIKTCFGSLEDKSGIDDIDFRVLPSATQLNSAGALDLRPREVRDISGSI